jgi:hypothetical protein
MTGRASAIATALALAAVALLAGVPSTGCAAPSTDRAAWLTDWPRESVAIETRGARRHLFHAWRADAPETRAQGLMNVRELADDEAMIFVYDAPQVVNMWMKNTYLPLDMLFVDTAGRIVKIAERTQPLSLETISSVSPVTLVIEIKGGAAAARGIAPGDRVVRGEGSAPAKGSVQPP